MQARLEPTKIEPIAGLQSTGRLPALLAKNRLGWKRLAVTNAQAYITLVLNAAVKGFVSTAPWPDMAEICQNFKELNDRQNNELVSIILNM